MSGPAMGRPAVALVIAALVSPGSFAAPSAPASCAVEIVRPVAAAERDAFVGWVKTHLPDAEMPPAAAASSFELRVADVDNDGENEAVLTTTQGSDGYLFLLLFRRSGEGWTQDAAKPLEASLAGAHDYFDPLTQERQILVRFCGRTYLTLLDGAGPGFSREAWVWQGRSAHVVCEPDWIDEQRRASRRLFDAKRYDDAYGFLDGVQQSCGREMAAHTWLWLQSDLALTAYRMGTFRSCLDRVAAAENSPGFAQAGTALRRALQTNAGLCQAAAAKPSAEGEDVSWLLKLAPDAQVVLDPRFDRLLSAIVPDVKVDDGRLRPLRDVVKDDLWLPQPIVVTDARYVILSGCRPHDCGDKGLAWIDTVSRKSLVAVTSGDGYLASNTLRPAAIPQSAWDAMRTSLGLEDGQRLTFVDRNGRKRAVTVPDETVTVP